MYIKETPQKVQDNQIQNQQKMLKIESVSYKCMSIWMHFEVYCFEMIKTSQNIHVFRLFFKVVLILISDTLLHQKCPRY